MGKNAGVYSYVTTEQDAGSLVSFILNNKNLFVGGDIYNRNTKTAYPDKFLKTIGKNGLTNYQQIYNSLSNKNKELFRVNYLSKNYSGMNLESGILFSIPINDLEKVMLTGKNVSRELPQNDSPLIINTLGIISSKLDNVTPVSKIEFKSDKNKGIKIINEDVQVWIYSKSLDKIIDVSPFISRLTTQKTDIGSFNFILDPARSEKTILNTVNGIISEFQLENNKLMDFFTKNIQMNDVVFIRFERLVLEDKYEKTRDVYSFEVNNSELNDYRVFDMIGLVDVCGDSFDANSTDYSVSISGRDLMKLLVEDGSYFLERTMQSAGGTDYIYGDTTGEDFFSRLEIGGRYDHYFFSELNKKIEDIIGFVFNHLSNLGVVKSNLFDYYDSAKLTTKYNIVGDENVSNTPLKGIWRIMDVLIDDKSSGRAVDDNSLSYPDSPLVTFLSKICHQPFVEWWGDTFYNGFKFVFREPPFTKKAITKVIDSGYYHIIEDADLHKYDLNWETEFYSWYRFDVPDSLLGRSETFSSLSPIIYFNEFMYYFGNHSKIYINPYLPEAAFNTESENDKYFEALLEDMLYIIETHIYLPFTRRGSIIINGDRRIKKGSFVKLNKTNELFYVDSVINTGVFTKDSVDRTTILTVKRGMDIDHIKGNGFTGGNVSDLTTNLSKEEKGSLKQLFNTNIIDDIVTSPVQYSYFDIVDLKLIKNNILTQENIDLGLPKKPKTNTTLKSILNENVFKYFIQRRQCKTE